MAGTKTPNSPNVAVLDSRIFADTCAGDFIVDASVSTFIGSGASNVLGARVKITNPYGVVIKPYLAGYDIPAPLTAAYEHAIPTQAGKQQYGTYTIALQLVDEDGTTYEVIKTVNVCSYTNDSHPCDDRLRIIASCKNGTVTVAVAEPPLFKGLYAESTDIEVVVDYPTASGLPQLTTSVGNFSMQLFQGVYKVQLTVCATYNLGDNVYIRLTHEETVYKDVKCLLDYTCIFPRIKSLNDKIDANCSQRDKELYASIVLDALRLLKTAELANDAGEDASDYIVELEKLLGCVCTCDCSASPIMNGSPSSSIVIEGCLVTKTTVGLTDVYTMGGRSYYLTVDDTQDVITVSGLTEYGCTTYQQLNFNAGNAYLAIKAEIGDTTEYNYWASVINNTLATLSVACLGYSPSQWAAFTFAQKIQALVNAACIGGACTSSVSGVSTSQVGADVLISFTQTGGFSSDVYVDGILKGTVLSSVGELLVSGYADGLDHDYVVVPKCANGSNGTAATGTFGYLACPSISAPVVSSNNVNDAVCPYDLTALVTPPPVGIETEWHTANNTNASSLVSDPTTVTSGVYYAFSKNADGCYSTSTVVTLICAGDTSCSAPQTLLVIDSVGGFLVSFQSAAFPPPSNSYTVKRKAFADPDVDGSYTTIGTPVWNSSTNRWEITDATGVDNTLYTYKAISNCSSSTPSVLYTFANLDCPVVTLTPTETEVGYSFSNVGGEVDKYEVSIYDSTGAVLISTQTIVPAFASPITGTFEYLTADTVYQVRVKVFIGTFSKTCDMQATETNGGNNFTISAAYNFSIDSVSGTGVPSLPAAPSGSSQSGHHTGVSGTMTVVLSGSIVTTTKLTLYVNGVQQSCQAVLAAGSFNFTSLSIPEGDDILVAVDSGSCS